MEVSDQLYAPACLPAEKRPHYQLDRMLSGPQNQSERGDEEKNNSFPTCRESNPGP
jgi:hypothetical protein